MSQCSFLITGFFPPPGPLLTLTGNTGGPVPPTGGNINIITAHSTVVFAGNPGTSTITQDFGLTNLILGSSPAGITLASQNAGFGDNALNGITTGLSNAAFGFQALQTNSVGSSNTAIGASSLSALISGDHNTAIGNEALELATHASDNTAVGDGALGSLTTGNNNIAIGDSAGSAYTTETGNIVLGLAGVAADSAVTRVANIYGTTVGGTNQIVVIDNTGKLGSSAGGSGFIATITGNDAIAESPSAGNFNIVTANSTAKFAGTAATETLDFGITNLLLGSSGSAIAGAVRNVGLGVSALNAITSASSNTAVGYQAGQAITTGGGNIAVGYHSLTTNTTGGDNVSIGVSAMGGAAAIVEANVAVGSSALGIFIGNGGATDGNVAVGYSALGHIATGIYNIGIGYAAGNTLTLGNSHNICLNHPGVAADANTLRIGAATGAGTQQLAKAFICGIDGVNVGSVAKVVTMASDQLGTATITAGSGISVTPGANTITIANTATSSISITGDSGGALTGNAFTFTGGTTGLTFAGAGTTETLGGTLAIANGGTNATSMANSNGVVYYDGTRLVTTAAGTTGQVFKGVTSGAPVWGSIIQGTAWSVITANQTAAVNNGYICNKAGTLALALPTTSAVGDVIEVTGMNTALGWQITQGAGQQIFLGTSSTTSGATGTLTSTAIRDSVRLVCIVANLTWNVVSVIGSPTIA